MTSGERLVPSSKVSRETSELRAHYTAQEAARTPARNPVTWFFRLVVEVVNKADRDRLLGLAAESAFFAVLTLFPALLVVAAVLGQLGTIVGAGNAVRVENAVLDALDRLLTDSAGGAVDTVRSLFTTGSEVLTVATVLALASLSTAFATLINTVNIVYDVPETRGWWRRRALGLLLGFGSVLTGAIAVTLLVIGPLFGQAQDLIGRIGLGPEYEWLWSTLRWPVAFGALVLWATTMDHLMPARRLKWRHDLPGGLLTALLWLVASFGLSLYLEVVVTASPLFGALGGGLILMTWIYLLCVALLAGGELNTILAARRRHRRDLARSAEDRAAGRRALEDGDAGDRDARDRDARDRDSLDRAEAVPPAADGRSGHEVDLDAPARHADERLHRAPRGDGSRPADGGRRERTQDHSRVHPSELTEEEEASEQVAAARRRTSA